MRASGGVGPDADRFEVLFMTADRERDTAGQPAMLPSSMPAMDIFRAVSVEPAACAAVRAGEHRK